MQTSQTMTHSPSTQRDGPTVEARTFQEVAPLAGNQRSVSDRARISDALYPIAILCAISILGGSVLILLSLSIVSPNTQDFLNTEFSGEEERLIFLASGIAALCSPLLLVAYTYSSLSREKRLRSESDRARKRSEKSERQALLLQDVLSHDIRNYNQSARLTAELLKENLADDQISQSLLNSLLSSIDGSTMLTERAKILGKITSAELKKPVATDITESIKRSQELMSRTYPDRVIDYRINFEGSKKPLALADSLLDELFVNLFSNSIKYSEGRDVRIDIKIEKSTEEKIGAPEAWKISVSDNSRGIPDSLKSKIFTRYVGSEKVGGLGMSIIYALVNRYNGRIGLKNKVPEDYTKGTTFEIWLPRAEVASDSPRIQS